MAVRMSVFPQPFISTLISARVYLQFKYLDVGKKTEELSQADVCPILPRSFSF